VIIKINNKNKEITNKIRDVFQASYAVEAKLLNTIDFPPLSRKVSQFINSNSEFYAYYQSNDIIGIVEVKNQQELTHIQSLVVDPKHFRKGIGRKLIQFTLEKDITKVFNVETGLKNTPALKLYESFNFKEEKQWNTNHGVRKVRFKKIK